MHHEQARLLHPVSKSKNNSLRDENIPGIGIVVHSAKARIIALLKLVKIDSNYKSALH